MADITKDELIAQLPDGSVKNYWANAANFPADAQAAELFSQTQTALWKAANLKNENAAQGTRIDSYPAPTYNAVSINAETGLETVLKTTQVRVRVPLNPDAAVVEMQ